MRRLLPLLSLSFLIVPLAFGTPSDSLTAAEKRVKEIISRDGIHLVHFWAPWCPNSIAELKETWKQVVEQNADVSITFVTVWNNEKSGAAEMRTYGMPDRVVELTLADFGPSSDKSKRRKVFLGLPFTWVPTTWIFHKNGQLAFAMNYGEIDPATLQKLIEVTRGNW